MNHLQAIDAAGEKLKSSELGRMSHIVADWNAINWKPSEQEIGTEAQVVLGQPDTVVLYPLLARRSEEWKQAALLREFGISVFQRHAGELAKRTWEEKLCLPEAAQISAVQERLKDQAHATYDAIVESFTTCMDRYVALNICNALMRPQFTSRESALNLSIYEWGSTLEYANLRRTHRIVPFVHAYGSRQLAECPGVALAEMIVNEMRSIRESSVARAFRRVIVETFNLCR
jgi:hypothetical protein